MVAAVMVAALMAAIAAAIAVVADAQPRVMAVVQVMAVADVPHPATAVVAVAIRRRAADLRTVAVGRRTAADRHRAVAADMGGDTALDSFPA
jgi:hypothetical protein